MREVLLLRVRAEGYELPKGGIEWDELPSDAGVRETCEEAAITSSLDAGRELAAVDYLVGEGAGRHLKRVRYFELGSAGPVQFGALPGRTRERRWVAIDDLPDVPLVNDALRPILVDLLATRRETGCTPEEHAR